MSRADRWRAIDGVRERLEVQRLLGKPVSVKRGDILETWLYQDGAVFFYKDTVYRVRLRPIAKPVTAAVTAGPTKGALKETAQIEPDYATLPRTDRWKLLDRDMKAAAIEELLGKPDSIKIGAFETWTYADGYVVLDDGYVYQIRQR